MPYFCRKYVRNHVSMMLLGVSMWISYLSVTRDAQKTVTFRVIKSYYKSSGIRLTKSQRTPDSWSICVFRAFGAELMDARSFIYGT